MILPEELSIFYTKKIDIILSYKLVHLYFQTPFLTMSFEEITKLQVDRTMDTLTDIGFIAEANSDISWMLKILGYELNVDHQHIKFIEVNASSAFLIIVIEPGYKGQYNARRYRQQSDDNWKRRFDNPSDVILLYKEMKSLFSLVDELLELCIPSSFTINIKG